MRARRRASAELDAWRARLDRRRRPRWGNLRRMRPFSSRYGFDRGTPADRVLLDRFFAGNAGDIHGAVLEVKDPSFTRRFGHDVTDVDIVDIDPTNPRVTLLADLAEPGSIPAESYDCVLIPQTLQYVDHPTAAVANAWRAVRPGGVLLVTVPALAPTDPDLGDVDRWRFTPAGLASLLRDGCPSGEITVAGYGSLVTSIAFLHGIAAEELTAAELDVVDGRYPILSCGRVRRPAAG